MFKNYYGIGWKCALCDRQSVIIVRLYVGKGAYPYKSCGVCPTCYDKLKKYNIKNRQEAEQRIKDLRRKK